MKGELLQLIGDNQTDTLALNNKNYEEVYGIYTYKGDIFCLKNGYDIPFDGLTKGEQKTIYKAIKAKEYVIDPTLQ